MIVLARSADKLELQRLQYGLYKFFGEPSKLVRDATVGFCGTVRSDGWRLEVASPLIEVQKLIDFCDGFKYGWHCLHVEMQKGNYDD